MCICLFIDLYLESTVIELSLGLIGYVVLRYENTRLVPLASQLSRK